MDGGELLTMEAMGDTMHSVTPAYLCNPGCKSRTELSDVAKHMTQLDISVEGDYVLISKEYTHAKGLVYQAGKQAKPVLNLSEASLVVWAPKNALWTSVAFE